MTIDFFDGTISMKCLCRNGSEGFIYADTSYTRRNNLAVSAVINVPSVGRHHHQAMQQLLFPFTSLAFSVAVG
eukprot:CAMPEP_0113402446 /NCGR_PEP_ID=MMETSP0013_2-20120614/17266_1 /TAXON_ID=2843 ORGANISM="Skeletonema costatum, Strain 1716" /NCGR_SAMPLE_ID=MMETSP0013_2 /ASSEMBLY_ACC=CAM_ASM_000158 /LENGTH=72 /DNA_ID=CAMNT_0000287793 /DNA_START=184 /DNA_END=398 /DNA_ORIENTATION=+ /assembly_acc=CAM_ASM_000158